ncbi:hypothetical protein [Bacillus cereus group sp. MYBK104-1]|uniref:hypothetical protein n=1 Tax=unclassified Bacillus cereus group TaxID=2750818 RepID=UPI003F78B6D5
MKKMYAILSENGRFKSNVAVTSDEDVAIQAVQGLRSNGILACYEEVAIWDANTLQRSVNTIK